MPLTDARIRSAPPMEKAYKIYDTGGLFLIINTNGSKWWRVKYRFDGKEGGMALGVYPYVSLADARKRRDEAKTLIARGISPSQEKKAQKASNDASRLNTFQVVAEEWLELKAKRLAASTVAKKRWMFNAFIYPRIGNTPIKDIDPPALLDALRQIEAAEMHETTHRARENCGAVFRYGAATGRGCRDITHDLRGALLPVVTTSHPAITKPSELAPLLRKIHDYSGRPATQAAFKLLPMLFPRSLEIREMKWTEIQWDIAEWHIPAERMKPVKGVKRTHIVPLPTQAIEILSRLKQSTGCYLYVFPNDRGCDHPMSNGAITQALKRSGYPGEQQTGHGFRATARTILEEVLGFPVSWIEMQLAHEVKDSNGTAYNRTAFLEHRKGMMQSYADYLDGLRLASA